MWFVFFSFRSWKKSYHTQVCKFVPKVVLVWLQNHTTWEELKLRRISDWPVKVQRSGSPSESSVKCGMKKREHWIRSLFLLHEICSLVKQQLFRPKMLLLRVTPSKIWSWRNVNDATSKLAPNKIGQIGSEQNWSCSNFDATSVTSLFFIMVFCPTAWSL